MVDTSLIIAGVAVVGIAVAALPSVADALDRRARRNATIDIIDQSQKFDFARDSNAGKESTSWGENKKKNNEEKDSSPTPKL